MLVTVIALKYALLVSQWSCGHFRKLTDSILCEQLHKSSPFNSTHHAKLYPQHGDRIVTIDSVTSLNPMYAESNLHYNNLHWQVNVFVTFKRFFVIFFCNVFLHRWSKLHQVFGGCYLWWWLRIPCVTLKLTGTAIILYGHTVTCEQQKTRR